MKGSRTGSAPRLRTAWVAVALALALGGAAPAEERPGTGETPAGPADELGRQTPRSSVVGYLVASRERDWERAARYLNLSPVPRAERERRGPLLARHLKIVLDRTLWVEPELLSEDPAGHRADGLPSRRDRVGTLRTRTGPIDIFVDRVRRGDGAKIWKISASTVSRIPELYDEFGYGALGEIAPPLFFESQFFEIQLWQWIGLLLIVAAAYLASWFAVRAIAAFARPIAARSKTEIDDRLLAATLGPLRLLLAVGIFAAAAYSLALSVPAQRFFGSLEKALGVVVATWFLLRLIDVFGQTMERRLDQRGQRAAVAVVPLGRKTLKTVVVALAVLASLDSFGFDVTALIAGLGVGGLAVALAAQKTLENLFGGATLIADRPVQVGDFCRFGDKIGTVEEIGMRSTRVRTLDRTLVTIPNAEFSAMQLENFSSRDKIWYHPRIGLRYETTPDQLRFVLVEIRKMLYAHPKVDPDPARVRFTGFGDFSLDIDIFAYILATDYSEYLEVTEDVNLRIMDIVDASGTGFAFPSSTTYLARDEGVDARKTREAEETVQAWRAGDELYLPGFTPEKIAELRGSLDFPPRGSALRRGDESQEKMPFGDE